MTWSDSRSVFDLGGDVPYAVRRATRVPIRPRIGTDSRCRAAGEFGSRRITEVVVDVVELPDLVQELFGL